MAIARKAIYDALFARLEQKVTKARLVTRKDIGAAHWAASQQPVLVLRPEEQVPDVEPGRPTVWRLNALVILYARTSGSVAPRDVLLELIEQVESALEWQPGEKPGAGGVAQTTLGGLVRSAHLAGEIIFEVGDTTDQAFAGVPIEMVAV